MTKLPAVPATATAVVVLLGLLLGLSACGGSDDTVNGVKVPEGASVSTKPGGGGSVQGNQTLDPDQLKIAARFVACMRGLGYDMSEPSGPGFDFAPSNANGMSRQQLLKVREDANRCSNQVGGSAITGG
ncbi:hypothetical protein ACFOY4_01035 [Actinomadura syzygii]|uniref:Uncharacterized protein n=1 Tax=Actinomadura syzygii TaxID=1427538 RepID=A0A5D0TUX8_9ACTN|nr:hypothetical protein [Actinomadura syzygii]TYC08659.1 hypothetical protein FXF65_37875 [Actinomadura syzygii]